MKFVYRLPSQKSLPVCLESGEGWQEIVSQNAQWSLPVTHLQELISVNGVSNQLERSKQKKTLNSACIRSVKE